jgi:hypothetical protein
MHYVCLVLHGIVSPGIDMFTWSDAFFYLEMTGKELRNHFSSSPFSPCAALLSAYQVKVIK